jgi:inner membrane protein
MDTITHGIAGALIGKALCSGDNMFPPADGPCPDRYLALMVARFFPTVTYCATFSRATISMITWHRSLTHSLLLLPLFSLLLAALTQWIAQVQWDAPPFAKLTTLYAVGVLSHILLDLVTTFGTICGRRCLDTAAWDLIFIVISRSRICLSRSCWRGCIAILARSARGFCC